MFTRRLLLIAGIVALVLAVAFVSLGFTVWSGLRDRSAPVQPTGPATAAGERARADLASRLGVAPDQITVESVAAHTWNDASLDLPEPGMMYAQVITSGFIVTLSQDGKAYEYHVAGETVLAKPEGKVPAEAQPTEAESSGPAAEAAKRARADLARRLGISADQIAVDSVEAHTWPDASLGLPEPGMMYAQVLTDGYIVALSAAGKAYVYHVAGENAKLDPNAG